MSFASIISSKLFNKNFSRTPYDVLKFKFFNKLSFSLNKSVIISDKFSYFLDFNANGL